LLCLLSLFLLLVVSLFAVVRLRFGLGLCLRVLVAAAFLFRLRSAGWPLLRLVLLRFGWLRSVLVVLFLSSSLPCPRCLRVAGVFSLAVLAASRFSLPRGLLGCRVVWFPLGAFARSLLCLEVFSWLFLLLFLSSLLLRLLVAFLPRSL
jgi:hypothetical protein